MPLPLPFSWAVHLPWPCKLRYVVGEPVYPDTVPQGSAEHEVEAALAERVRRAMEQLLAEHGTYWA